MKYKYFLILFLAVLVGLGHITFSEEEINPQEDSASWWMQNIPEITLVSKFDDQEQELQDLISSEKVFAGMESLLTESQKNLGYDQNKQESILEELTSVERNIRKNILRNENEIQQIETEASGIQNEIEKIQTSQKETSSFIKKTFTEKYKKSLQTNTDSTLGIIFFGDSFGKTLSQNDTNNILQNTTETLLLRQKSLQENLELLQTNLAKKLKLKQHASIQMQKNREELRQAQEVEQNILSNIHGKVESIGANMSDVKRKKQSVEAQIIQKKLDNTKQFEIKFSEYEKTLTERFAGYNCGVEKSAACTWMNQYLAMEKQMLMEQSNIENQKFMWPVTPSNGFGTLFRDQKYYTANNTHHEGTDILTPLGFPVQSIADGYILIKQNPGSNSPGIVIVKHPNNLMSVYVGINPTRKPMFSRVSAGDNLGTSRQYLDHSGQNNIHIELYDHGKAIDILEKLDLSGLKAENVPPRYGWKYIDDLKKISKQVDINALRKTIGFFFIGGDTESERQKKFLETYASPDFQDRSLWISESLPESIDPTFVMCIGFAESSLGKNLTTDGNIGNVGNTDSGARKDFSDSRSGIKAIASVLNNNWLGGYTTIDQLSGWGNTQGPIYASSHTNWHENIVKCMSAIKQKYVGNSSPFRLTQAGLLIYQQEGFSTQKNS